MPPSNKDSTNEEVVLMLKEALKSINGTIDFNRMGTKIGAPNGEAARKRLKRFFEKDAEPLVLAGSVLGDDEGSTKKTAAKTPKASKSAKPKTTPVAPANDDDEDGDNDVLTAIAPKKTAKKATPKKRKAEELAITDDNPDDDVTVASNVTIKAEDSSSELSSVPDTDASATEAESPKKKAKTAINPRTPKSAKKPTTPKAPQTPKSPLATETKEEEEI